MPNATANPSCRDCDGPQFDLPIAMAFQPIVDVDAGRVFAYEALVRGPTGEGADTVLGRVTEANRYAFDQQCRVAAIEGALAAGLLKTDARLSINFLPNAVRSPLACIQRTLNAATAAGLPLDRLIFEFTENEEMASPDHVAAIIETYKRFGFSIALDDFGAGQSGLELFARFAPDIVKLDMALIRHIDRRDRSRAIVRSVVGMCAELDTLLIGEGVETAAEAEELQRLGIRHQQGFLYARPGLRMLPAVDFSRS